jgi:penicillin amidase
MKKVLWGLLILFLLIPLAGYLLLRSYLPDYEAQLKVPGLKAKVGITRNRYAVPTIEAQTVDDLYFAWGYVNAQDRMFQMETTRRIGQGRISEFAGESALEKDVFIRAVGFYELARTEAENLPPEHKRLLQRYVDGVNHFLETEKTPLYFTLLGLEKEKWTVADPVVIGFMLNWTLAYNMSHEILYSQIAAQIGKERSRELLNFIPPGTPAITALAPAPNEAEARVRAWLNRIGPLAGGRSASNNWVIAPQKSTVSGPILSSDPHVHGSKIPSDFYLIRLKAEDFEVAGGQVSGLPFIAFGYNRHAAWGLTNQGADMVDLFVEKVNWERKTCLRNGAEVPLRAKTVTIKVKGKPAVEKTLYYAGRRPLLAGLIPGLTEAVSLDWAGFDDTRYIAGFLGLNRAKSYAELIAAVDRIHMSPQNMVYAERQGNIGYRTIGTLVDRRPGSGNFPPDANKTDTNWQGLLEPGRYPALLNPPQGFIATANNLVARDFPVDMNPTVAPRYRWERIAAMATARDKIDPAYIRQMQLDTTSELAKALHPRMLALIRAGSDPRAQSALDRIVRWDGKVAADDPAPAIYNTWLLRFMVQTFSDELGPELAAAYVGQRYISLERFLSLLDQNSAFFDDTTTPAVETAADIAGRAFQETLALLSEATGKTDVSSWTWGAVHGIRFDHLLGRSALLRPIVNRGPYPLAGDCETNLRAHFNEVKPPFTAELASGLRLIVRFDPEPQGDMVLITGQNEYFLSPHYDDLTRLWLAGGYFSMEGETPRYTAGMTPN